MVNIICLFLIQPGAPPSFGWPFAATAIITIIITISTPAPSATSAIVVTILSELRSHPKGAILINNTSDLKAFWITKAFPKVSKAKLSTAGTVDEASFPFVSPVPNQIMFLDSVRCKEVASLILVPHHAIKVTRNRMVPWAA